MTYRVKILPRAQQDIETLYQWIIRQAPLQGTVWYNGLLQAMASLNRLPRRCRMAPDGFDPKGQIRHLLYGKTPYQIYFWIEGQEVQILHVRRGGRGPATL